MPVIKNQFRKLFLCFDFFIWVFSILKGRNLTGVGKGGMNVPSGGSEEEVSTCLCCCCAVATVAYGQSSQLISPCTLAVSISEQKISRAIPLVSLPPVAADLFWDALSTNLVLLALIQTGICPTISSNSHFATEYYQAQDPVHHPRQLLRNRYRHWTAAEEGNKLPAWGQWFWSHTHTCLYTDKNSTGSCAASVSETFEILL